MKLRQEGFMKRSNPFTSGEKELDLPLEAVADSGFPDTVAEFPHEEQPKPVEPPKPPVPVKKNGFVTRITNLAIKGNVTYGEALKAWNEAKQDLEALGIDPRLPTYFGKVTNRTKDKLGIPYEKKPSNES